MSTRGLYTDDEEFIFDAQRPVVLTGIANMCERDDLRDRALILTLPAIPEHGQAGRGGPLGRVPRACARRCWVRFWMP